MYKTRDLWTGSAGQWSSQRRYTSKSTGETTVTVYGPGDKSGRAIIYDNYLARGWNTQAGWKAFRAANGYLPTLPMWEYRSWWKQPASTITYTRETAHDVDIRTEYNDTHLIPDPNLLGMFDNPLRYKSIEDAQMKALSKARDLKVNIPVMFGEGRQTVSMITGKARTLARAYRAFRRGRFKEAARALGINKPTGSAANHWLEYAYGWMPLISDTKGLAELAAQQLALGGRPKRFTARGRSAETQVRFSYLQEHGIHSVSESVTCKSEGITTYEGMAGLLLEVEYSGAALASQMGMGSLPDAALFAWELTPFSFVFDWFIDIGGRLEAASALTGLKVVAGYASQKQVCRGKTQRIAWPAGWQVGGYLGPTPFVFQQYYRDPWLGGITSIQTPLWDALNARRITTLAALWRQRLRGDRVPGKYRP